MMKLKLLTFLGLGLAIGGFGRAATPYVDRPFEQTLAVHFQTAGNLQGAVFKRLAVDRNGVVHVLTDRGVARLFDKTLALDNTYRPLAGKHVRDLTIAGGNLFYLLDNAWLSNSRAGWPAGQLPRGRFQHFALGPDGSVLLAGKTNLAVWSDGQITALPFAATNHVLHLYAPTNGYFVLTSDTVFRVRGTSVRPVCTSPNLTALAFHGPQMVVGSTDGFFGINLNAGRMSFGRQTKLPSPRVTCLTEAENGLWVGTTHGVFWQTRPGRYRYFASKRWLPDDDVIDVQIGPEGNVYVLTRLGLGEIEFRRMTLAQKAAYYDRQVRLRHIRYGFCSELRLRKAGDLTSGELIDTDNDGLWSSLYMASQAFRFAVTGSAEARANAWGTFDAIERLQSITGLDGYPARSFERTGYKVSDPSRWHTAKNPNWEWKGQTSSDEITGQAFGYAVMYQVATRTPAERHRLVTDYDRMLSSIVRHNLYLVGASGQPTLWGRWNPDYVNQYPPSVFDRRLNSSEIIAFLQLGFAMTGKPEYRAKANELFKKYGYLANITNSMANIHYTSGVTYHGMTMGDEWNYSDDELAFINYWTLYRFAFSDQLRRLYAGAIRDHWLIVRDQLNPLWNFIYAMTGAPVYGLQPAIWTLQRFPLDLRAWTVTNSDRHDLTFLQDNFRHQYITRPLPPDERPLMRWNGNPFALDGGDGGHTELAGTPFLLPYWMGRYLGLIR